MDLGGIGSKLEESVDGVYRESYMIAQFRLPSVVITLKIYCEA